MMDRRKEREFALKVLYASEYNDIELDEQFNLLKQSEPDHASEFAMKIVKDCTINKVEFDELIKGKLKNWKFERVAVIDRVLLRMALTEFICFEDVPPEVTMDEIIEISKLYSTDRSDQFINGILDALIKQLKSEKRIKKSGRGLVSRIT
ncbi:MAG: transcription antitermination factor NusB [Calditrichaeota bacterium]|nr:MAG: transcription antitermination factor NusB [Calditrichota bacterium]MBL1206718.1 transcription antitermination factor NusB [Calditrichota bacterium]NOG46544.1 transcription antitermination factor NusB [Calditrichota bacterium]